jgi:hypothetical protein
LNTVKQKNKNDERTMNGQQNNGQQNENKYKWTEFRARRLDDDGERSQERYDRFDDVEISSPTRRRGATTTRDFERGRRAQIVVTFQHSPAAPTTPPVAATPTREEVERPRTRSARRAADAEAVSEANAPAPAPMPKPTKKREQRNDYWVNRDDQRRNSARTFKTDDRWNLEEDEEGVELED